MTHDAHAHVIAERELDRAETTFDVEPDLPEFPIEIPVHVTGPVRTQEIGCDMASSTNLTLTATDVEMVLSASDTRAYAIVISATQDFYVGPVKAAVKAGTAGVWPAGVPLRTNARNAIYARTTSGISVVSTFPHQIG